MTPNQFITLSNGELLSSPLPYHIETLILEDIDSILQLEQSVLSILPAQQTLLTVRDKNDYTKLFESQNTRVQGVFIESDKPELIGLQVIELSHTHPEGEIDSILGVSAKETSALYSHMVSPQYRGNKLLQALVNESKKLILSGEKKMIVAYNDAHNPRAYGSLLHCGFGIGRAYIDSEYQAPSYAMIYSPFFSIQENLYYPTEIPSENAFLLVKEKLQEIQIPSSPKGIGLQSVSLSVCLQR